MPACVSDCSAGANQLRLHRHPGAHHSPHHYHHPHLVLLLLQQGGQISRYVMLYTRARITQISSASGYLYNVCVCIVLVLVRVGQPGKICTEV